MTIPLLFLEVRLEMWRVTTARIVNDKHRGCPPLSIKNAWVNNGSDWLPHGEAVFRIDLEAVEVRSLTE
jgi:hypothetical protein